MVAIAQLVRASDCGSEGLRVRSPLATPNVTLIRTQAQGSHGV